MATKNDQIEIPGNLSPTDVNTFLKVFDRASKGQPGEYPSFRELFSGLGTHTTVMNRLGSLFEVLIPKKTSGVSDAIGERLKLLFHEVTPNDGLRPTKMGKMLADRLRRFGQYFEDIREEGLRLVTGHEARLVARIGVPQTLAMRLLAYAFSHATGIVPPDEIALEVHIDSTRKLLPQLKLGGVDAIVSYGFRPNKNVTGRFVYKDPDIEGVNFVGLGRSVRMILITHPDIPLELSSGISSVRSASSIDPLLINLRKTTLISVPSWRQGEAIQDLVERAKRVGRHREVTTYDEALALVRMGGGFALVPEMFSGRQVVECRSLAPESQYSRELGVYYRRPRSSGDEMCVPVEVYRFLAFLGTYLEHYELPTYPVYLPRGEDQKAEKLRKKSSHEEYEKIVQKYRKKYRNFTEIDWVREAGEQFPMDAPVYPEVRDLAAKN